MTTHHVWIHIKRVVTPCTLYSHVAWRADGTHRLVAQLGNPNLTQKTGKSDKSVHRVVFSPCFPHVFVQDETPLMDLIPCGSESHHVQHDASHEEEFLDNAGRHMEHIMVSCPILVMMPPMQRQHVCEHGEGECMNMKSTCAFDTNVSLRDVPGCAFPVFPSVFRLSHLLRLFCLFATVLYTNLLRFSHVFPMFPPCFHHLHLVRHFYALVFIGQH